MGAGPIRAAEREGRRCGGGAGGRPSSRFPSAWRRGTPGPDGPRGSPRGFPPRRGGASGRGPRPSRSREGSRCRSGRRPGAGGPPARGRARPEPPLPALGRRGGGRPGSGRPALGLPVPVQQGAKFLAPRDQNAEPPREGAPDREGSRVVGPDAGGDRARGRLDRASRLRARLEEESLALAGFPAAAKGGGEAGNPGPEDDDAAQPAPFRDRRTRSARPRMKSGWSFRPSAAT